MSDGASFWRSHPPTVVRTLAEGLGKLAVRPAGGSGVRLQAPFAVSTDSEAVRAALTR
jgi:hypothetical protein